MSSIQASGSRLVVLIDGQNMYKGARNAFGWRENPAHYGNFRPFGLGRLLAGEEHDLKQVRIYTGIPSSKKDPRTYAMQQRRFAAWVEEAPQIVKVFTRPLRYAPGQRRGMEKGIDVQLAVDLVALAIDDKFDAVALASTDTDLLPPLEFIRERFPQKAIQTVAWNPDAGLDAAAPLDIQKGGITRRRINRQQFNSIADRRNFTQPPKTTIGQFLNTTKT